MPDSPELTEAKRALLNKYLRGEISMNGAAKSEAQALTPAPTIPPPPDSLPVEETVSLRVPIVPVHAGGSKRPLFFSHVHVEGGAFYCFTLANRLGPNQPFYLLEPYHIESGDVLPTIEEIAAATIESMRTVQPHGPYMLSGFCGGGLIVYEMAHQLKRQGEEVDFLLLVEPLAGPGPASYRVILRTFAGSFIRRVAKFFRVSTRQQLNWFLRLRHYYLSLRYGNYRQAHKDWLAPTREILYKDWIGLFAWQITAYRYKQYPGKVTYFWAQDGFIGRRRWRGKPTEAVEREIIMIPGDQYTCRNEDVQAFAEKLYQVLNRV